MSQAPGFGRRLYRLLFSETTIVLEGQLLLAGIVVYLASYLGELPWLTTLAYLLMAPFTITLLVSLLVIAPWMLISGRWSLHDGGE